MWRSYFAFEAFSTVKATDFVFEICMMPWKPHISAKGEMLLANTVSCTGTHIPAKIK